MPWPLAAVLAYQALWCVYGHTYTGDINYISCFRFWAGNWPHAVCVLTDRGMEKMQAVPSVKTFGDSSGTAAQLGISMRRFKWMMTRLMMGHMWLSQLCFRLLPALLHEVIGGRTLSQANAFYMMELTRHVLGFWLNCSIRLKKMIPDVQRVCQFEEGEAFAIFCDSFPSLGRTANWQIVDFCAGRVASGAIDVKEALHIRKPSDTKLLLGNLGIRLAKDA